MSSGTTFIHSHYFSGETYDNLWKVQEELEDLEKEKRVLEDSIISYVLITEPKKFISDNQLEECDDIADLITTKVREWLEELRSVNIKISTLKDMVNNWSNMHETIIIKDRKYEVAKQLSVPYDYTGIDGDYIYTAKELREKEDD